MVDNMVDLGNIEGLWKDVLKKWNCPFFRHCLLAGAEGIGPAHWHTWGCSPLPLVFKLTEAFQKPFCFC